MNPNDKVRNRKIIGICIKYSFLSILIILSTFAIILFNTPLYFSRKYPINTNISNISCVLPDQPSKDEEEEFLQCTYSHFMNDWHNGLLKNRSETEKEQQERYFKNPPFQSFASHFKLTNDEKYFSGGTNEPRMPSCSEVGCEIFANFANSAFFKSKPGGFKHWTCSVQPFIAKMPYVHSIVIAFPKDDGQSQFNGELLFDPWLCDNSAGIPFQVMRKYLKDKALVLLGVFIFTIIALLRPFLLDLNKIKE
jgi:hypothetical protein